MNLRISKELHNRAMASGVDVPSQPPGFAVELDQVGISGKTFWVLLPEGRLPFTGSISVALSADYRGIHMSRLEEAVSSLYDKQFEQLPYYADELALLAARAQESRKAVVRMRGALPLPRSTPVSACTSIDSLEIEASAVISVNGREKEKHRTGLGVILHHLTACPCTQAYNGSLSPDTPLHNQPTHSQRSRTELMVETGHPDGLPGYHRLLECLESELHPVRELLKRPDETELVLAAMQRPQFAEDAVRDVARAASRHLGGALPPATRICIRTESLESIHGHNVECCLDTTMARLNSLSDKDLHGGQQ